MRFLKSLGVALVAAAAGQFSLSAANPPRPGIDWPTYRGIQASGVSEGRPVPATWSVPGQVGIKWQAPIAGLGHSSPIIWGESLCVTTAISGRADAGLKPGLYGDVASVNDDTAHTWKLICLNKQDGKVAFERTLHSGVPKIKRHTKSTHASSTLATDGSYIVAMLGTEGLFVFDMKGTQAWKKDLGVLDSGWFMDKTAQWAFGSSPIIHDSTIILQADVQQGAFLGAFDLRTGKEKWRTPRADVPTWGTPTIVQVNGKPQIIVNGWKHIGAYDFSTGKEVWRLVGGGDIPVPTPIVGDGLVYITNAHGSMAPIYAIKTSAIGDISLKAGETSNEHIAWSYPRDGGYLITPILYRGVLYVMKSNGAFQALDAKTGTRIYQDRLGNGTTAFTASPVAADGKIYFSSEEGDTFVVEAGRTFKLLGTNPTGEIIMATPAISEGVLFIRTAKRIVAVGR